MVHHERVVRRPARWGSAFLLLCVACSSNPPTVSAPTSGPSASRTTSAASTTTTTEPSGAARSRSLCTNLTPRFAGAAASSPSSAFQGHRIVFANRDMTAELLTARDAFYEQLSPL